MNGQFTADNAAEMARKSAESRRKQKDDLRLAVQIAVNDPALDFAERTLARVRLQLEQVNERLSEQLDKSQIDPQAIDRLASAQSRLSEQERILAGRPTPGALRPSTSRSKDRKSYSQPSPAQKSQVPKQDSQEPNG